MPCWELRYGLVLAHIHPHTYTHTQTGADTPDSDVRSKYKKLSRKLHPDLNQGQSEEDLQRYKDVQRANEILSDRKKRKVYDMMGHEGLKQLEQQSQGHGRQRDPFFSFFGGGGGGGGPDRGPDISMTLRVRLDDVYMGAEHVVPVIKQKLKNFDVVKGCMKCKAQKPKMQRVQVCCASYPPPPPGATRIQ